jgi:hypothetical protein
MLINYHRKELCDRSYHLLVVPNGTPPKIIGALQVKHDFRAPADPELIRASITKLSERAANLWSDLIIWLPFPGIGAGRLSRDQVYPILMEAELPSNVTVWEYS